MISRLRTTPTRAVFSWRQVSKNNYRLLCGSNVVGSFSLSLEPSILFEPAKCEFYRACAETGDGKYFFKCVFLDGEFRGCLLTQEGEGQPLALFEQHSSNFVWCRRSRIVLCEDGTIWPWVRGGKKGHWILRGAGNLILELKSSAPELHGTARAYSRTLLKNPRGQALILFCIYLAMGPQRQSTHG